MFILFSLIVMRMSGAIAFNPVFGRVGIPSTVKAALILVISTALYLGFGGSLVHEPTSMFEFGIMLVKELLFGFALGFGMELSFLVVRFASAVMDYTMGLSMAQVYDPQYNTQMTITSGLYYAMMVLLFFSTDGHIRLIGMFVRSSVMIPFGMITLRPELPQAILRIFQDCIFIGFQFSFPVIAMGLVTEAAMGVLMRVVPQINIFAINFQLKIIVGMFMMLLLFGPMSDRINVVFNEMYRNLEQLIPLMR